MKYLIIFLFFVTTVFTSELKFTKDEIEWIKNNKVVKLGADYRWPPFDFVDNDGKHTGLSSEYIKLISKKSGLKFDIHTGVWANILTDMKAKKYDGLTSAVATNDRKNYLKFTDPYLTVPMVIISTMENNTLKTINDLTGKKVAINKASYIHEWLKTKYPNIKLYLTDSNEASLEAVSLAKADAYIGNLAVATYIMNKYLLNNLKIVKKLERFETAVSIAIDKNNTILFNIIQKSLKSITPQENQKIKMRWKENLGDDNTILIFTKKQQEWIKEHKIINFVIDNNWKPIEYLSKLDGKFNGITSEYMDIMSKKTGIEFRIVDTKNWADSVDKINSREADLYSCVANTPSRQKVVNFSDSYIKTPQVFITKKNIPFVRSLESINDKTIVLLKGYSITEMVKKDYPEIRIIEVEKITDAFELLINGKAYAYIDILPVTSYYIQKEGYSNLKISGISKYKLEFSMALRNDWGKEGIEIINMVLDSITQKEKSDIYNKYSHVEYDREVDYKLIWQIIGVFILLIIASLFWNRKLSVEIKRKKIVQNKLEDSIRKIERKNSRIEKILKISDKQTKELIELNERLEELSNSAQSANKAKSDFLSNMSHEIRTPMNAILGFAELLDSSIEDKKLKSFIKTIRSSGQTLLFLINDILDLSKIESGKLELVKSKVNINNLFEESTNIFKLQMEQKGLELILDIDNKMPKSILIDPVRLKEILINLLGNALKFTDDGYIKVSLVVDAVCEHTSKVDVTIKVEDSGIGIPLSQQEKIFNIFEQTENQNTRKYGGTGLGLTICRKLANLMNGSLVVESELGKGSSFIVNLKNIDIASLGDEENELEPSVDYSSIKFQSATILIVDDVKENRDLVKESFSNTKIKIIEAQNGKESIDIVKDKEVDLILMDIRMPVMDGYTATRLIKDFSTLPIIALTASIMQDELNKIGGERFDGYLRKPVSINELFKEVSKFLAFEESLKKVEMKEEIVIDNIEELKNFLDTIDSKTKKLYIKAIETNDINLISDFSNSVLEIATKYNIKYMIDYSELLLEKIDAFEIDSIAILLDEYNNRIKSLKSKLKNH